MAKKSAYARARQSSQMRLRMMKESWWMRKSQELQDAADRHDMKQFYDGLKKVFGPHDSGSNPVRSKDGTAMLTDAEQILNRWAEHFESLLNQPAVFDDTVLNGGSAVGGSH